MTTAPGEAAGRFLLSERFAMNKQNRGSWNIDDPKRPKWGLKTTLVAEYEYRRADGSHAFTVRKGINPDGEKVFTIRRINPLSFSDMAGTGDTKDWLSGLGDEKPVLFRLPELIAATTAKPGCQVLIPEGEKDVMTLVNLGYVATCNPMGALKWKDEYSECLKGCDVIVIADNDARGAMHAFKVACSVKPYAKRARVLNMPKGIKDITEWVEARARGEI
jgi:5S rRNA maturation endonuclease (ribonuclease M5)